MRLNASEPGLNSSSMMTSVADAADSTAPPVTLESSRDTVSFPSTARSLRMVTANVRLVTPGAKFNRPFVTT